jgi:hypothetical protein
MMVESLLLKLNDAFNNHDIDSFADCFATDYSSEQPLHPDRSFKGREQARKNWQSNFIEMPDFTSRILNYAINNNTVWAEWEWNGTRQDKSSLFMRGVTIFGVEEGKIKWGRLYVEPVQMTGKGIEAAVKEVMQGKKDD